MPSTIEVKKAIINVLKADESLMRLLGKDKSGNIPIYHSLVLNRLNKPCITIEDISSLNEISALNDGYDGSKRIQFNRVIIQIDCWSNAPEERDRLADLVEKALLKSSSQAALEAKGILHVGNIQRMTLDEPDWKPPVFRKMLRYTFMYEVEAE